MPKLNLDQRKRSRTEGGFSPVSSIKTAEELKDQILARRKNPDSVYWDLEWSCSLAELPADDVDVDTFIGFFFREFSQRLQDRKICSGIRWVGVYVREEKNSITGGKNPHCHGFIKCFRKGQNSTADIAAELSSLGSNTLGFKPGWVVRPIVSVDHENSWASYLTGETLPTLWLTERWA